MGNCIPSASDVPHLATIVNYCTKGNEDGKTLAKTKRQRKFLGFTDTLEVWNNVVGEGKVQCVCPICETNMMVLKDRKSWEIAHILSHHNGGNEELTNLRPTCKACNRAMGKIHMVDYIKNNVPKHRVDTTLKRLKLA